jgi:hypothetical protein
MKILLAIDGSEYSRATVEEAARTPWPEGSVVSFVSVAEIPVAVTPLSMSKPSLSFPEWIRILEERSLARPRRWRNSLRLPDRELR